MRVIPIVFSFDQNLQFPACVSLFSLLRSANRDTFYDIFILSPNGMSLNVSLFSKLSEIYGNFRITLRNADDTFDSSYEIRGITTPAYYRLLIPELIPEYDKILYSDVDVIFRKDLSDVYFNTDIEGYYLAGVDSLAHLIPDLKDYYEKKMLRDSNGNIYSGNLLLNSKKLREDRIVAEFRKHVDMKYKFQDMDIINIVCKGKIKYLSPSFCYTTYIADLAANNRELLETIWTKEQIQDAQDYGIVHYNGQKPWKGACINFDIWWECYRKSPFFDSRYYYHFFDNMLNEYDRLPLLKRLKILLRYFLYGQKK